MDYKFTWALGRGFGIVGRAAIAVAVILALKYLDKSNSDTYNSALKKLALGGAVCIVVSMLIIGIFRGAAFFQTAILYRWLF